MKLQIQSMVAAVARRVDFLADRLPAGLQRLWLRTGARAHLVPATAEESFRAAREHLRRNRSAPVTTYLEFGVFQGTSMSLLDRATRHDPEGPLRLIGFDSFEGMPAEATGQDRDTWRAGQFSCSEGYTRTYLQAAGVDLARVELVKGWFSDTCNDATTRRLGIDTGGVGIVMVDCDLHSSTAQCLSYVEPMISDVTVFFFDDWHSGPDLDTSLAHLGMGERRAFDEWMVAHPGWSAVEHPEWAYNEWSTAFVVRPDRVGAREPTHAASDAPSTGP